MIDGYDRNVFINCPFDHEYQPILQAMIFAVHDCGFIARTALEVEDGGEVRITKIKRIIRECRYGVHDISRVELDPGSTLPRFNMPLELGLFLGAQEYGSREQRTKKSLILDAERYRYQVFCSDIAGQDIRAHENSAERAAEAVRQMLATALGGEVRIPGATAIMGRYEEFREDLPLLCIRLNVNPAELQFVEYRSLVGAWLARHPVGGYEPRGTPWGRQYLMELVPVTFSDPHLAPAR